jgi:exopolysaccharide biosynthesis WecB/TagA/CpsF family protein
VSQTSCGLVLVITANTDHVTKLRTDEAFAKAYREADLITCDGWPVALYARFRGHDVRRVTGYDICETLMRRPSIPERHRLFFVVDSTETEDALYRWATQWGLRDRIAAAVPKFGFDRDPQYCASLAQTIAHYGATLLVMGVGAPRSEVFVNRYADVLPPGWAFCVGQAVRVEVKLATRAPRSMQLLQLEWLWRILKEPKRLLRRYWISTVGFIHAVAADSVGRPILAGDAGPVLPQRVALVASMYGQRGGGMGRIIEYLLTATNGQLAGIRLMRVDTRGQGRASRSPHHLAVGLLRAWLHAFAGRAALLHVNMAERGSIFRKGVMMLALKPFGTRSILHLHAAEIIPMYGRISAPNRFFVRSVFRMADRIVVLGDIWRRWLINVVGIPEDRIDLVYNGVPEFSGQRVARAHQAPFRVLFLANLHARKGLGDLIPALAALTGPAAHWQLSVAGGGNQAPFRALAQQFGVADRITFLGWVDHAQAQAELGKADSLVLPSYEEGLPLVILEALAAGVPVLTTPVGAIGEVLEHDVTALIVQPGDQASLSRELERLFTQPELHQQLAVASRSLYLSKFSLGKFAENMERVYVSALYRRAGSVTHHSERETAV